MAKFMPLLTAGQRLVLGWGKVRRYYYGHFRDGYVARQQSRRRGECLRCGACCKLMFYCPHLSEENTPCECVRHDTRWKNCSIFPIDERDLADRDMINPETRCGYCFYGTETRP